MVAEEDFESEGELFAEIERLTAENAILQSLIQHPGDGTCDRCGSTPAVPVNLCEECQAKVQP